MARAYKKRAAEPTPFIRWSVQTAFLLLNLWIGVRFYMWVHYYETGGASLYVPRPPGVEGWLPIAGLMSAKYVALTGVVPQVHPAGVFLFIAFVAISVIGRKAFCSWLCPIGTVSEWLWKGGQEMFRRNFALPRWADVPLRSVKYLLLGFFAYVVVQMSADDLRAFLTSPYAMLADVKMLAFFREPSRLTIGVCSLLVILSVVTKNFWCRYLCPYGALMGLVSMLSPVRITRDPISCIDCGKCTNACPSLIPVGSLRVVRTPECTGCFSCVSVCPVQDALELRTRVANRRVSGRVVAVAVCAVFLLVVGYARATGAWYGHVPERVFFELIPNINAVGHE